MKASDLKELTVDWMRAEFPGAVIVPELSVADWGSAMVDVAAITETEIVGVEIKGEGDSPSRLELQGLRYGQVCRRMWLLCTPEGTLADRCNKRIPSGWGRLEIFESSVRPANTATKAGPPEKMATGTRYPRIPDPDNYRPCKAWESRSLNPWAICGTLWRDELYDIAQEEEVIAQRTSRRANVQDLTYALVGQVPVLRLHEAMIRALRRRIWKESQRARVIDTRTGGRDVSGPQGMLL